MCSHLEPAYSIEPWHTGNGKKDNNKLSESYNARNMTILLPLFHVMNKEEQSYIAERIINYIERY